MKANESPLPSSDGVASGMPMGAPADTRIRAASPLAVRQPPAKSRRRRRWLIVLGCLLVLAAIPVAGYFYVSWTSARELELAIAEIEAVDPRWQFRQIIADRPEIADADNPALVLAKVDALLRAAGGFDIGQENYPLFENLPAVHQLNQPQIAALRPALAKHEEALKLARTLKQFSGEGRFTIKYGPDYFSINLEPLQRCRNVMYLLQNDAMLRAEDDDASGAMESCQALLVASRSIGDEPFLIAALIRYAGQAMTIGALERTLAQCEPSVGELEAMQELLAREIDAPLLVKAMRGERAGLDQTLVQLESGKLKASMLMGMGGGGRGNSWEAWLLDRIPVVLTSGRAEQLRLMQRNIEAAKLPPEKQREAFNEVDQAIRDSSSIVVRMLMPAVGKVSEAHRRQQANLRCAMVAVAAERYRIRHQQWPAKLDDLVAAGLLKEVPIDPYNGERLRYKRRTDGVVVYSVGHDAVDDGGAVNRTRPLDRGVDQGFELWDAAARRQAPLRPAVGQ
jgi:competence protein ComGC